jgi:hypothetical protein
LFAPSAQVLIRKFLGNAGEAIKFPCACSPMAQILALRSVHSDDVPAIGDRNIFGLFAEARQMFDFY